jgi:hypothetical protein
MVQKQPRGAFSQRYPNQDFPRRTAEFTVLIQSLKVDLRESEFAFVASFPCVILSR